MHASEASGVTASHVVSQADADACCAGSERRDTTPPAGAFAPPAPPISVAGPLSTFAPSPAGVPALDAWRSLLLLPGSHAPKHLLLSVFLI